jgi:MarR-like DNA-binding transcriptional regulator SgrR of sgrS sRNA
MLVSMSDKELKRLSVLQEICDQRITQSQAAQLLHISERQIRRLLQKYKAQGPAALAHAGRGQISNSNFLKNSDSSASILFLNNSMVSDPL